MSAEQIITQHIDLWTATIKARKRQGRGSNKKRELYGIKKLRELILELAVRGKLVPQEASDEPASVLLERIAAEKAQLVKDKKIKKQKVLPEITDEEKQFELPEGWAGVYLDSISDINGGFAFKSSQYIESGVRVIRISDFDEKGFKDEKVVRHEYSDRLRPYILEENNILMAMTGGTVGKSFLVDSLCEKMVTNQRVATIKISPEMSSVFVSCVLQSSTAQNVIHEAKNSTNDNISMSDIKSFYIPIPAIDEQGRIVAKVDELMALCDQLEQKTESSLDAHNLLVDTLLSTLTDARDAKELSDNWARLADHFDTLITTDYAVEQLKQTILQLAVTGKLVPQNRNDEPASELLKRIAAEKAQLIKDKKIKKQKPLPEIDDKEKIFGLPNSWQWSRMDDFCFGITSGSTPPKNEFNALTGAPYLKVYNIRDQFIDFEYRSQFVNSGYHSTKLKRSILYPGDVIMNIVGPPLGKVAIIPDTYPEWNCNQAITFFRPIHKGFNAYIYTYIKAGVFLQSIDLIGTAGQDNISVTKSRSIVVPIPPLKEQHRIVAKVDELMSLCNQLRTQLNDAQTTQLHLSDAVVENALTA